jgi:threonine/homoserine/homoserine lactone efflux protein
LNTRLTGRGLLLAELASDGASIGLGCVDLAFLVRGTVIGFSIAAPVGPIGVLCIRRTIADGRLAGLVSGLGAATADAAYGTVAGFGLTAVSAALIGVQPWLRVVGGVFLCYLGVSTFVARPADLAAPAGGRGLAGAYGSTLLLTLTNPMTILSFGAVFAGLGLAGPAASYSSAVMLVAGVFTGSALWWLTLSGVVGAVRHRFDVRRLRVVNRVSGAIIAGFGVLALAASGVWR